MNDTLIRLKIILRLCSICIGFIILFAALLIFFKTDGSELDGEKLTLEAGVPSRKEESPTKDKTPLWVGPDSTSIPHTEEGKLIAYGRELIAHTALYLGPKGTVRKISNGMNCQNCHLKAGTKPFGNNYSAVASTYPKFRARSGSVETIEKRVNDCIERSLNGKALANDSKEMKAILAYMRWVGQNVKPGVVPPGSGIFDLKILDASADPAKGKEVYITHCVKCHGPEGKGIRAKNGKEWLYPPLNGDSSFNIGAGLFRLSRFAGFIKANMPYGVSYDKPLLTDEEAWNIAAYVTSLPRPTKDLSKDWPDIATKPFDYPFGPFADNFSEQQHKFGPFGPFKPKKK
jgi:thiosulfate dehydrogenase